MRYTVRAYHKTDAKKKWGSTGMGEMYSSLEEAIEQAAMMNKHPGNPGGLGVYAVFEYHGRGDYRIVDPK